MNVQTLIKQWLSSPAHRLVYPLLIVILSLGLLWWAMSGQPVHADPAFIYVRTDGSDTLCNGEYDADASAAPNCAVQTIGQGVFSVTVGGTVNVAAGTYRELIDVTKSLTLTGESGVIVQPSENIPDAGSNHDGAVIWIQASDVTVRDVLIDGDNPDISGGHAYGGADINAFRGIYMGGTPGSFDNVLIEAITLRNLGRGIDLYGGQNHTLRDNFAENLGGPDGDNYGFGMVLHGGSTAQISGNTFYAVMTAIGVSSDSAGQSVSITATNNFVNEAITGLSLTGTEPIDHVTFAGNRISDLNTAFRVDTTGNLYAYANNIADFVIAINDPSHALNARHNWWGSYSTRPVGVDDDSWNYRLGAPMETWGMEMLADATLTSAGGSGQGIIVGHGSGAARAPFGQSTLPYGNVPCSDYYDFFVLNATGAWTVRIPLDTGMAGCGGDDLTLYRYALTGGGWPDTGCSGAACWLTPPGVTRDGDYLEVTVDADTILSGTPFIAGGGMADLVVSKTNFRPTVQPGETLAYLITITNTGNVPATVSVTDTLPAITSFLVASDNGQETTTRVITWPEFTLPGNGARTTRLVIATVGHTFPAGVDTLTNTVTATAPNEANETDNTAWDIDQVNAAPDLTLSKSDGGVTTTPGNTLAYTLTYANLGNQEASGVVITETVPTYTTFNPAASHPDWNCVGATCTYPVGSLPGAATRDITFTVNVDALLPAGVTQLVNTAAIADDGLNGPDTNPTNNTATTTTAINAAPLLTIGKSNGVDTVTPGDTLTYQIIVTNTGNQEAAGVVVSDALPAHTTFVSASDGGSLSAPGVVTWPAFTLDGGGASATCALTVTVANPFPVDTNLLTNTATVADAGITYATAVDVDAVNAAPSLALSKDDGTGTATPGNTLIYRLVITNSGNQLAGGIVLTDTLPAHTTFTLASDNGQETAPGSGIVVWPAFDLPGGGTGVTRLLVVTVDNPLPAGVTAITNTAVLRDNRGFTAPAATDVDAVNANPNFILTKTNAVTTTTPGATLGYAITITNTGNQGATGILISDTLPADVTFGSASNGGAETAPGSGIVVWPAFTLASGASATRYLTVTVNATLPPGLEVLINTVDAGDDRGFTATNQHVDFVAAAPDLAIAKTDGGLSARPGATLVYTLTYSNQGDQDAAGVGIVETVPAHTTFDATGNPGWTCADGAPAGSTCTYLVGDLPVSASHSVTFSVRVVQPLPAHTTQTVNTATITDNGTGGEDGDPDNNTATLTTTIVAAPDLVVSKDDNRTTAQPGETLSYRITVTNTGDQNAASVFVTDTLPLHTTFLAASDGGVETEPGVVTWPAFSLVGDGGAVTRLVVVTVDSPLPAGLETLTNTVSVATANDANPADNTAWDTDTLIAAPDLALTKSNGTLTVEPGDTLVYTLTYANLGNQEATGVVITETVPTHTTFNPAASHPDWNCVGATCTYIVGSLPGGATRDITFTVNVDALLPAGVTQLVNTAAIADDGLNGPDTNPTNNTAGTVTPVSAAPDLTLAKSDGGVTATPGATLVYTLTYANLGNQEATGVVLAETVPAHTTFVGPTGWNCVGTSCQYNLSALPATAAGNVTFTVRLDTPLPSSVTYITNTASIGDDGSNGADTNPSDNVATISTPIVAAPDLVVSKDNGRTTAQPGETLSYRITITNTGNLEATGILVTDTLPLHTTFVAASDGGSQATPGIVTWPVFNLPGGSASVTRLVVVTVDGPLPAGLETLTNTVSVATANDANPADNTAWDTDTLIAAPDLALTKRNGTLTVEPGDTLIYTLTYANLGNQEASGVVITETVPTYTTFNPAASHPDWNCVGATCTYPVGSLPGGATRDITFTVNVDALLPAGVTQLVNTAAIADDGLNGPDTNPANNTAGTVTPVSAAPDLTLAKSDGGVTATPGATLVYTLTYANTGNQEATGVVLAETVPTHTTFVGPTGWNCVGTSCQYNLGALPATASGNITFAVTIVSPLPAGVTQINNTATLADDSSNGTDPTPTNNTATTLTPVEATPDLEISKSNGVSTVQPGDTLTYQIVVTNTGDQNATGVRITDNLPAYTNFVGASDGGNQTTSGVVTWPTFALNGDGASVTRLLTVTVADPFPADTNILTNTAIVADDGTNGPDPTPTNNTAEDVDTVIAAPILQLSKDDGMTTVVPGNTIIYRLIITNSGSQLAAGIVLTDTLPAHTTFYLASDGGQETAPGSDIVIWPAFNLSARSSTTRLLVATVDNPLPANVIAITNTAMLRDNRDNTAETQDIDAVNANPLLFLDKTNAVDSTVPGATLVYTLTLTNNGNQEATGILITDTLPADVSFVAASDGGYTISESIVAWPAFNLAGGGASVTRYLTVAVNPTLPAGLEMLINTAQAIEDRGYAATAQHADLVIAAPDLAIAKSDGGSVPRPGEVLQYTLTYTNTGNQEATGVVITETVPAYTTFDAAASSPGWMCADGALAGTACTYTVGSLPARASDTVVFAVRVVTPLPVYVRDTANTATITDDGSNGADTDPENNSASIITPFTATVDLVLAKDDGDITVEPGETIVYTLTYANTGNQIAGGVIITETVPALTTFNQIASSSGWTCAHGAPAGATCTYAPGDVIAGGTVRFAVDVVLPFPLSVNEITNQAVIGADANNIADADPANNTTSATTPVITRPDLVVGKDDGFSVVLPDQQFTYVISVTNVGTQNATNVRITDTLPAYVTLIGASDGGIQSLPGVVTWPAIAQLGLDEVVTRTLSVMLDSALPAGVAHITNTVSVGDDGTHGPDLNPADNTAIDVNVVGAMPDLVLDKTVNRATTYPTGLVVYTIRVENTGSQGATGISIIDTLPSSTNFVNASNGGYESTPGIVTWPAFTLNVGQQAVYTLSVRAASGLPEDYVLTNTATVSDDGTNGEDPTPGNNTDSASTTIKWPIIYLPLVLRRFAVGPDLIVDNVVIGNGTIAITIKNQGKLIVTDTLGFWVDLYINPSPAPTGVNQTWDPISPYGAAWGVDREALPIRPGESRTLYLYDIYYKYEWSRLPVALRAGDIIYVQVDSYNAATTYGVVLEDHEMSGTTYNNIVRLIVETYTPLNPVLGMQNAPVSPDAAILPERP